VSGRESRYIVSVVVECSSVKFLSASVDDGDNGSTQSNDVIAHPRHLLLCSLRSKFVFLRPPRGRDAKYSVSVCFSVRSHISKTARPNFTKFSVAYGYDSVLLWRRCDMLCNSSFLNDVTFSHGASCLGLILSRRSNSLTSHMA